MQPVLGFQTFLGKHVHLGVTGSIAAYKTLDLLRMLVKAECVVSVTLTDAARRFVQPLAFEALGACRVNTSLFDERDEIYAHLEPGASADVLAVVPATANILAKMANGLADDMLSCQALAFDGPVVAAPAMNPRMWNAVATRENWRRLLDRGVIGIGPGSGLVACGDEGEGKLAPLDEIAAQVLRAVSPQDLRGKKVLTTLGPTREPWDAVRFWSNPSTGLMGGCIAAAAWLRGADVTVVAGPIDLWLPAGIDVVPVTTAREMYDAVLERWPASDIACLTAAVADFRPKPLGPGKFKKADAAQGLSVEFETNPDILRALGASKRAGARTCWPSFRPRRTSSPRWRTVSPTTCFPVRPWPLTGLWSRLRP